MLTVPRPPKDGDRVKHKYGVIPFSICWLVLFCLFYAMYSMLGRVITNEVLGIILLGSGVTAVSFGFPIKKDSKKVTS